MYLYDNSIKNALRYAQGIKLDYTEKAVINFVKYLKEAICNKKRVIFNLLLTFNFFI